MTWRVPEKVINKFEKNELIFKPEQRSKIEKHSVFTEKVIKIILRANNDKRVQSIDSREAHTMEGANTYYVQKKNFYVTIQ